MQHSTSFEEMLKKEFGGDLASGPIVERALRESSLQMRQESIGPVLGHLSKVLSRDQISCAHLVCVSLIEDFIKTQQDQKGKRVAENRAPCLSRKDGKDLAQIADFVCYMADDESFAGKLTPIPGLLSASQVVGIQRHWHDFALYAAGHIRALGRREVDHSVVMIDHAAPIRHLLESPNPMSVIYDLLKALIRRVDQTTGIDRDRRLRDLFVVGVLLCQGVFRPGTCMRLKYSDDDSSNVVREINSQGQDVLRVVAEKELFKNWKQEVLKDGFSREIINLFGRVKPLAIEYLDESRHRIVGQSTTILAVNTRENPAFTSRLFAEYLRRLTAKLLLVDLDRKYGDVFSLNCTQIRKLVATAMWRAHPEDKKVEAVSHALMNEIP